MGLSGDARRHDRYFRYSVVRQKLEQNLTMLQVLRVRDRLSAEMEQFCLKNSIAADAFVKCGQVRGDPRDTSELPTRLEQVLKVYAEAGHLEYELKYVSEEKGRQTFKPPGLHYPELGLSFRQVGGQD